MTGFKVPKENKEHRTKVYERNSTILMISSVFSVLVTQKRILNYQNFIIAALTLYRLAHDTTVLCLYAVKLPDVGAT